MERRFFGDYRYITSAEKAEQYCNEIKNQDATVLGIDAETTGLNPLENKIRLVQIAIKGMPVYIFDIFKIGSVGIKALQEVLAGSETKIFHNAKFDLKFLHMLGIKIDSDIFDTMLAEQVIISGSSYVGFKLSEIADKYLGITLEKELQKSNWARELTSRQLKYAANDVKILVDIYEKQLTELENLNLLDTIELENKAVIPTYKMELAGFRIDKRAVRDLKMDIIEERVELSEKLQELIPDVDNYNSPAQVKKALLALGLDIKSTEKNELMKFKDDYLAVDTLLQYKKITKRISLLDSLVKAINPKTGRIHSNYWQCSTKTGRYSCTDPNLQGVPNVKEFRRCFAAGDRNLLVVADYSQIELRIIAEVADDETMIGIFNRGEDIHRITASIVNKKPVEEVTPLERQSAKAMNFGLIYGMGYNSFQQYAKNGYGVDLTYEETRNSVDKFFLTYRSIGERLNILDSLFSLEERTLGGRRRFWEKTPIITERANAAIQGTGADILKQALVYINDVLLNDDVKLIATVHDEIILECPAELAEHVSAELKSLMEKAGSKYLQKVPVVADVAVGSHWADK
jgi:DNA polymerase I-like protein with 3'-5' exonuclease and polymerase domains